MERFDYRGWDLEEILSLVSIKYEEHMEERAGFPHEIGLLLGYLKMFGRLCHVLVFSGCQKIS